MNFFSRGSLKRSIRTRTRKDSISVTVDNEDNESSSLHSSSLVRRKTRPPPLQIIPELSENELDIDLSPTSSPTTARPAHFPFQQLQMESPRVTLSAYTFSIDDALLMFGEDTPRSPALSASSSTTDGASSEGVPATPGASDDDDDGCSIILPIPRLRPQRVSIRPLCITKTRSLICHEDENICNYLDNQEEKSIALPLVEAPPEVDIATVVAEEAGQDFYSRELEDFISLSPVVPFHCPPARRDSLTLVEASPMLIGAFKPKPRGRSRHSKPLPLLPPPTPPMSSFPLMLPLGQTTNASVVHLKRNVPPLFNHLPSPEEARPLPRMAVPLDVEDYTFQSNFDLLSRESIVSEFDGDDASAYSRPSIIYTPSSGTHPFAPAMPETPLIEMYGEAALPRSSTDSDAPRSSVESTSSFTSSPASSNPTSPVASSFEDSESESTQCLRSRWSSSTLGSVAAEPARTGTILSPLKSVLSSRVRRTPQKILPQSLLPSKHSKSKLALPITPSPRSTPSKHVPRQGSRSSTSSGGTSASDWEPSHDGSPNSLQKKPVPILMFLRST